MFGSRFLVVGGTLLACISLLISVTTVQSEAANQYSMMERVSAADEGLGGGSSSSISSNGRYVVFESTASDLMPQTIEDSRDVFIRDRQAGAFERASVNASEQSVYNSGEYSSPPVISGNGRFVVFMSMAGDLVPNDDNGSPDIFLRDRLIGNTEIISRTSSGAAGNGGSFNPAVSADGRYVVFQSFANNLNANDKNRSVDIFLRDRQTGLTELVSVNDQGLQGDDSNEYGFSSVAVSDDGRFVAFSYESLPVPGIHNLAGPFVYLRDRQQRTTQVIAAGSYPVLSNNGRYLTFVSPEALVQEDQNLSHDVYLFDREANELDRISVAASGAEVPEQYIFNAPDVSADGRYVVFQSTSDTLTTNDNNGMTDIFLRDREMQKTILVSGGINGVSGNGESFQPAISDDGKIVTFTSGSNDLVANDTNDNFDIFALSLTELGVLPGQIFSSIIYMPIIADK